jgi:hypothetical protein
MYCNVDENICIQNSEVNIEYNVIITKRGNPKSSAGQHRPLTNAKVGSEE